MPEGSEAAMPYRIKYMNRAGTIAEHTDKSGRLEDRTIAQTGRLHVHEAQSLKNVAISPEIADLLREDKDFRAVLFEIIDRITGLLEASGRDYGININYRADTEEPQWVSADIIVRITDSDYEKILSLWEKASSQVEDIFSSLRDKARSCEEEAEIDRLSDFISIRFV